MREYNLRLWAFFHKISQNYKCLGSLTENMLKGNLLHPEILQHLASAGHGAKILIADGNYPFSTGALPETPRVYLNLTPGVVNVIDTLIAILSAIEIEAATVMMPSDGEEPLIFQEFRTYLPEDIILEELDRYAFYDEVCDEDTALVIATAEERTYANILVRIGVIENLR